jgi:ribosomal 50S subunit-recycling heat shock protein
MKSLNTSGLPAFYNPMNKKILCSLLAVGSIALSGVAFAGSPSTYQVTGPVTAVDDSMITVMKGKEKFEVARDSSTKVTGDLKVGDKVTIMYTMTAKEVEVKSAAKTDKADKAKKDDKAAASPSPSAKK